MTPQSPAYDWLSILFLSLLYYCFFLMVTVNGFPTSWKGSQDNNTIKTLPIFRRERQTQEKGERDGERKGKPIGQKVATKHLGVWESTAAEIVNSYCSKRLPLLKDIPPHKLYWLLLHSSQQRLIEDIGCICLSYIYIYHVHEQEITTGLSVTSILQCRISSKIIQCLFLLSRVFK